MWSYTETVRVEEHFGRWYALVTLHNDGVPESFHIEFALQPTAEQIEIAAQRLATQKNVDGAVAVADMITQWAFRSRFTMAERIHIDNFEASALPDEVKATLRTIHKDFDALRDGISLGHPDTIAALDFFESVGLLAAGRAAQIRGV